MDKANIINDALAKVENYSLDHLGAEFTMTFPQGDIYVCRYDNGEWIDNDENPNSSPYKEWYELDFRVIRVIQSGPNRNPEFDYITVSEKNMPSEIRCGEITFYDDDRAL